MKITPKIKKDIRTWVRALRSKKYRQTTGQLQDETGHCCLGVACDLFIPKKKLQMEDAEYGNPKLMTGALPAEQAHAPAWLKKIGDDMKERSNLELFELNDDNNWSFAKIANLLEVVYLK